MQEQKAIKTQFRLHPRFLKIGLDRLKNKKKEKKRLFFDHLNLRRKKQRRNKVFLTCIKSCLRRWERLASATALVQMSLFPKRSCVVYVCGKPETKSLCSVVSVLL